MEQRIQANRTFGWGFRWIRKSPNNNLQIKKSGQYPKGGRRNCRKYDGKRKSRSEMWRKVKDFVQSSDDLQFRLSLILHERQQLSHLRYEQLIEGFKIK